MFGTPRLLDPLGAVPVLALVAIARVCEVDWSVLTDQISIYYEYRHRFLISIKDSVPLKRVLLDGFEEWYDGTDENCSV